MPELPEVETIRRQLEPALCGASILAAWAFPSTKFSEAEQAIGADIGAIRRRGKYLLVELSGRGVESRRELVIHLGMTGRLSVTEHDVGDIGPRERPPTPVLPGPSAWARSTVTAADAAEARAKHLRASWQLSDGRSLLFHDVRRFGRVAVVVEGDHGRLPTLAALGPEPFDDSFSPTWLRDRVNSSTSALKQLLSQRIVAGVGNIYADEALWRAGVHPASRRLTHAASASVRDAVRAVLDDGLRNGGTTLRDYRDVEGGSGRNQRFLDCYGRSGEPCVRCGELLRRTVIDSRSTTWCPGCQRRSR